MNKDLTVGKPGTVLWQFCLPLFGSVIFQQLYNIADSWVAGKFIGQSALAAVGNSYEITLIFIAFAFGCNMGCSVTVSGLFGARDYSRMKTAVYTAMITTGVVCLCLMLPGLPLSDTLLRLIQTPAEVFTDSKRYLDIYLWGLPFLFFYNLSTGIFSALGDSKTPFIFLAISSLSNIALDILFVTAFQMGVAGVAWATFLCQGISCVLAVMTVWMRLCKIKTKGKTKLFDTQLLKKFATIAIPSTLQQSFISIGNIIIQGIINSFGGLFRCHQAEQSGDHILYHHRKRHLQLYCPESGFRKTGKNTGRLSGRPAYGMDAELALCSGVFPLRRNADGFLLKRTNPGSSVQRLCVPADRGSILLCGIVQADSRRNSPGQRQNEAVYDGNLYGSDPPGGAGLRLLCDSFGFCWYLVRLAHWLDSGNHYLFAVL